MKKTIDKTLESMRKRNFKGWYAGTTEEAQNLILSIIPIDAMVGLGDSSTIRQLSVVERLRDRGNRVVNPFDITKVLKNQKSYKILGLDSLS